MNEFPLMQHAETHKVGGSDPLDSEALANAINLADLAEKLHSSLTGVTTSQHHVKTVSGDIDHGGVVGLADDDHDHYWNDTRGDGKVATHTTDASAHHVAKTAGIVFNLGLAATGTKLAQILIPASLTISLVKIYADTAPTGATLIVDVNKNGTTIFTTQGNRPTIAIGGHADDSGTPEVTSLAAGDRLSIDIDQVGSTIAGGNDLLVVIICP